MDYTELLPPLSEPEVHDAAGYRRAFTADQVRAAQLAAIAATAPAIRKAEMERAAQQLDRLGCDHCAAAIRALPEEP